MKLVSAFFVVTSLVHRLAFEIDIKPDVIAAVFSPCDLTPFRTGGDPVVPTKIQRTVVSTGLGRQVSV